MKLKKGQAIRIDWTDAAGRGGWADVKTFPPPEIRTVGWYIKETRDGVYYTSGIDGEDFDTVLHPGFIPKGCSTKIKKLR